MLAALLHVLCGLSADRLRLWVPASSRAAVTTPIDFVFASPAAPAGATSATTPATPDAAHPQPHSDPQEFSELPEDRADVRPQQADLLSNVDSRSRDRRAGGLDNGLPELKGRGEAPHVGMEPTTPPAPLPAAPAPAGAAAAASDALGTGAPPSQPARAEAAREAGGLGPAAGPEQAARSGESDSTSAGTGGRSEGDARQELLARTSGLANPILLQQLGNSDIFQEEMDNPGGNVQLFGDVSLNTIRWAYAPWLQHFFREVQRNWRAPYAYYLGVIHGYTLVELEVARDGKLMRLEVLGEEGHSSLREHSVAALRSTAPFAPLPADFPEPSLLLRLKMIYPDRER